MSPDNLLERMINAYSAMRSYSDSGIAQADRMYIDGRCIAETEIRFATQYQCADRFQFWFRVSYLLTGQEIDCSIDSNFIESTMSMSDVGHSICLPLRDAIFRASGVSGGAAYVIASLLLPEIIGQSKFRHLSLISILSPAAVGGRDCHRVRAQSGDATSVLWIDKADYLLRGIDEEHQPSHIQMPDGSIEELATARRTARYIVAS